MRRGDEAGQLVDRVAALGILIEAFLEDAAEIIPDTVVTVLVAFRELGEFLNDAVGDAFLDRGEDGAFLNQLTRDVERQIRTVGDEAHETQPVRQDFGILRDQHAAHVELGLALAAGIEKIERPRARHERKHGVFVSALGAPMDRQRRRVVLVGEVLIEVFVFIRRDRALRLSP